MGRRLRFEIKFFLEGAPGLTVGDSTQEHPSVTGENRKVTVQADKLLSWPGLCCNHSIGH